jgi:predicted GNAT family N-acyltransferase
MIEMVTRDEIVAVRHEVLRPGRPVETALYPEDEFPGVFHLADRDPDGRVIACATFFPDDLDGQPAWRLRGMATLQGHRSSGIGGRLLEAGIVEVARRGGTRVWCNGRSSAGAFYRRHGFSAISDEFMAGPNHLVPHFRFARTLRQPPGRAD